MRSEYVPLGRLSTAVYRPITGPAPHVAFIYQNGGSTGMSHVLCSGLAARGFLVLCSTTRMETAPRDGAWERVALDMKAAMEYVRSQSGITRVVLVGHSGGGANSSFYQAVAENGVDFCKKPNKLTRCGDELAGLPSADAIIFPDAHPGLGVMSLRQINPSVSFTANGIAVDSSLDPFNPANGFNPNGASHYSLDFQKRYFAAQAAAMNALIAKALPVKAQIDANSLADPRQNLVLIPATGMGAHLDILDPAIPGLMQTSKPRKILHNDGSITTEIAHSVSHPEPRMAAGTSTTRAMFSDGTTHFLSQGAVRAKDSLADIDFCSSNSVTLCNIQFINVPVLFAAMGASTFLGDDERMYELSASKDKDYIVVEGAVHGFVPCTACETTPGQYSHSLENILDYMRDWTNKRF